MPIQHPPYSGQFLICDYKGFVVPEMVKRRPVIVISPRDRYGYNLVHVIPLSTTDPHQVKAHHIKITMPHQLIGIKISEDCTIAGECWAKCDLVNTVSFQRLELIPLGRNAAKKRMYSNHCVDKDLLLNIRKTTAYMLGARDDISN
jgi:uncharacterized protein YifN (PemK superfamily)